MAKKDNHITTFAPENTSPVTQPATEEEPVLYESEAYGNPQPDEGTKTTVMKPVGIGGPVPIVAPKHNTIQLQPIVVPLAVVPYMTQDSDVLRTDGKTSSYPRDEYAAAVEFDKTEQTAARKRKSAYKRLFSFGAFVFAALLVAAYLLAYFKPSVHAEFSLAQADVIGMITAWVEVGTPVDYFLTIVNCVGALCAAVVFLVTLFGMIFGKYARKTVAVFSFFAAAAYVAEIIYRVIRSEFNAQADAALLAMLAVSAAMFVLSVVFAVVSVKKEDKEEDMLMRHGGEI